MNRVLVVASPRCLRALCLGLMGSRTFISMEQHEIDMS